MRILVWTDKHSTQYYDASTPEALDAACIEILKNLLEYNYLYEYEPYIPEKTAELAKIDLSAADENIRPLIEKDVLTAKAHVERETRAAKKYNAELLEAREYVENGHSPFVTLGVGTRFERVVPKSWSILQNRHGGEYEDYELIDVEEFKPVEGEDD